MRFRIDDVFFVEGVAHALIWSGPTQKHRRPVEAELMRHLRGPARGVRKPDVKAANKQE